MTQLMNLPTVEWGRTRLGDWAQRTLAPALREFCGSSFSALIEHRVLTEEDKLALRRFAEETQGKIIDPETLRFVDWRVDKALRALTPLADGGFRLDLSRVP